MRAPSRILVAALVVGTGGLAACDKKAEPAGIGRWRFNHLELQHVARFSKATNGWIGNTGVCQTTSLSDGRPATWCFAQTPYKVGNRVADVDAYFLGTAADSKLIEVQLKVRGCVEADLEQFLRQNYGPAIESKGARAYWKNSFLWIAAVMPSDPGRCLVHMLPITEVAEIARIKAEGDLPPKQ